MESQAQLDCLFKCNPKQIDGPEEGRAEQLLLVTVENYEGS